MKKKKVYVSFTFLSGSGVKEIDLRMTSMIWPEVKSTSPRPKAPSVFSSGDSEPRGKPRATNS